MGEKDPLKDGVIGGNTKQKRMVESPGTFTERVERSKGNPGGTSQCLRLERSKLLGVQEAHEPPQRMQSYGIALCMSFLVHLAASLPHSAP